MAKPISDDRIQRAYRIRVALFLMCGALVIVVLFVVSQGVAALTRLQDVEHERDRWQHADQIIQALTLRNDSVVGDLGCGSGYFAMRLSQVLGGEGRVLAVDIRRLPLFVLKVRALLGSRHNIDVIEGQPDDPRFGNQVLDAVLVANTYHELTQPRAILEKVARSLRRGGRLVVVDRGPAEPGKGSRDAEAQHHELSASVAEMEILQSGFEFVKRQDHFIEPPGDEPWWLFVARKP